MDDLKKDEDNLQSQDQKPQDLNKDEQVPSENNPLAPPEQAPPQPHSPEFQQQLDQFRKAAAGPEGSDKPTVVHHKKTKLVQILLVVLVLALVGGGVYWFMNKSSKPTAIKTTTSTVTKPNYLTGKDKYVCAAAAETAILCENVETKAMAKYEIPHAVGLPYQVIASPDGSKIIFVSSPNKSNNSAVSAQIFVVDNTGNVVKQLPDIKESENMQGINWLNDSKSIVYDLRTAQTNGIYGLSQLYIYDITTGKSTKLTKYKNGLRYPVGTSDGKIIAFGKEANGNTPQEIASINSTDGSVQVIDTSAAYAKFSNNNLQTNFYYSRSSNLFYAYGESKNGKNQLTVVAKLVDTNGKFSLVPVATYKKYINTFDTFPIVTSKGALLSTSNGAITDPLQLYNGASTTDLKLYKTMIPFSANHPLYTKTENTSQLEKSDYLYEYTTPPAQLHTFLDKLTTDGCIAGQFRNVVLISKDTDKQAEVSHGDCGPINLSGLPQVRYYYIYENGQYKAVVSTKDVVSCKDATKYGLSKVVLPDCAPPGQRP